MTEWTVVGVIIALIGLIATIIKPFTDLTRSITKLTVVVDGLQQNLADQKTAAHESHQRLWDHNDKQDDQLNDHEQRLVRLEK